MHYGSRHAVQSPGPFPDGCLAPRTVEKADSTVPTCSLQFSIGDGSNDGNQTRSPSLLVSGGNSALDMDHGKSRQRKELRTLFSEADNLPLRIVIQSSVPHQETEWSEREARVLKRMKTLVEGNHTPYSISLPNKNRGWFEVAGPEITETYLIDPALLTPRHDPQNVWTNSLFQDSSFQLV